MKYRSITGVVGVWGLRWAVVDGFSRTPTPSSKVIAELTAR